VPRTSSSQIDPACPAFLCGGEFENEARGGGRRQAGLGMSFKDVGDLESLVRKMSQKSTSKQGRSLCLLRQSVWLMYKALQFVRVDRKG
jgi:hypothetical protein